MVKRIFDFVFSLLLLVVLFPLFFIISLIIVLDSKGGVFYKQKRVGKNNVDFTIFKFRTMYIDSEKKGWLTVGSNDNRITQAGFFLRKYKLDELPQLLNVLLGNMSFVGPRPEVRHYVDQYTAEQLKVLNIKPGITDNASILYANENEILACANDPEREYVHTVMPAKLALNLKYISEQNFFADMKILFLTCRKIFFKR